MKLTKVHTVLFAVTLSVCLVPCTHAQGLWQQEAVGCAVDDADVTRFAASTLGYVTLATGVAGGIYMRCGVTNPMDGGGSPGWDRLYVTYKDPDATGTGSQVKVFLKRISRSTGSLSTIATFNSNSFSGTGTQEKYVSVTTTWDFAAYYYFLEIYLGRTSTTSDVRAYGFSLQQYFGL